MDGLLPANNRYLAQHDIQLVEQFLTEMSSLQPWKTIKTLFLVGTTNYPGNRILISRALGARLILGKVFSIRAPRNRAESEIDDPLPEKGKVQLESGLTVSTLADRLRGLAPGGSSGHLHHGKAHGFQSINRSLSNYHP